MHKKITYVCDFCGMGFGDSEYTIQHESICDNNPESRHCNTCVGIWRGKYHQEYHEGKAEAPHYCKILDKVIFSDHHNCPGWKGKVRI